MKTTFIANLSNETQEAIKLDLTNSLTELGLQGEELNEAIENGMDSRLSDLEDTININKYL